ncbi:MAG: sugar phosphate isomerase/epimerase family protein [Candidatus Merdivicinus sp.]|jgi:D-psicose/D-tagatose/L-ribulose 3-epimerase
MIKFGCCLPGASFMPQGEGQVPPSAEKVMREGTQTVLEAGYRYSETGAGFLGRLTEEEVSRLEEAHAQGKLPLEVCNSFIPGDLPILDPSKQQDLCVYVEKILSRASRLGIGIMVFGSGAARRIPDGMSREEGIAGIHKFLRMCNEYGEKYGVTIAIEPLNSSECNVLNTVAEGAKMVHTLNLPRVRLLADAFHMYCEKEDLSILKKEAEILVHIHVAEPPARVYPGRDGGEYLKQFAAALKDAGYDGRVSVECGYQDFEREIEPARVFLEEAFA